MPLANHEKYLEYQKSYRKKNLKRLQAFDRARGKIKSKTFNQRDMADAIEKKLVTKGVISRAKRAAKLRGLEFNLIREELPVPEFCPVLGIPLNRSDIDHSPSLDRINNKKGYTKDNVIIVSNRANKIKRDATVHELQLIAKFYGEL